MYRDHGRIQRQKKDPRKIKWIKSGGFFDFEGRLGTLPNDSSHSQNPWRRLATTFWCHQSVSVLLLAMFQSFIFVVVRNSPHQIIFFTWPSKHEVEANLNYSYYQCHLLFTMQSLLLKLLRLPLQKVPSKHFTFNYLVWREASISNKIWMKIKYHYNILKYAVHIICNMITQCHACQRRHMNTSYGIH